MIKNTLLLSQSSRPDPVVRAKTAKAGQIFFSTNTQDKEIASGLYYLNIASNGVTLVLAKLNVIK